MDKDRDEFEIPEAQPDKMAWVLSYCDLLSQLIAFFVLLFAMSSIQSEEWSGMVRSLSQRLSLNVKVDNAPPAGELSIEREEIVKAMELPYLHGILVQKFADSEIAGAAEVSLHDDRIIISFSGQEAFQKGSITMQPGMEQGLEIVAQFIRYIGNRVEVNGNADASPIQGGGYPSNWELSLDRARVVGDYLKAQGYPYPIRVYGRGASGYFEIPPLKDKEERDRMSRRIDIVIRSERANAGVRPFP